MGKNNPNANREKVDHRKGKKNVRGGDREEMSESVPQELIEKAAVLGCEVWQIEEFEKRKAEEEGSDGIPEAKEGDEDSDLSEESKAAVKPKKAKAKSAAANREMPPSSSEEEEEEKKAAGAQGEESSDDDAELERLYGMGRNNNKSVKIKKDGEPDSDEDEDEETAEGLIAEGEAAMGG